MDVIVRRIFSNGTDILSTIINNVAAFPHLHLPPESILFCAIYPLVVCNYGDRTKGATKSPDILSPTTWLKISFKGTLTSYPDDKIEI